MLKRLLLLCGAVASLAPAVARQVVFSEVMYHPVAGKPEFIEVWNISWTPLDMAEWSFSNGVSYTFPGFNPASPQAHFLKPLERIVVSSASEADTRAAYPTLPATVRVFGPWTGALDNAGERISLDDKNGVPLTTLSYRDSGKWPIAADGAGHSLVLINENHEPDDWKNWRASTFAGGTPGNPEIVSAEQEVGNPEVNLSQGLPVINYGDTWSFYKETSPEPPSNWNSPAFTPSAPWGSGPGLFGFETAPLPSPGIQTPVQTANLLTYYFRTNFNWSGATTGVSYSIDLINDDGVIFYLNGQELGRVGTGGSGPVPHNTTPSGTRTVGDATEEPNVLSGTLPANLLVNGANTLAAIAVQVNATSSDMVFGARFKLAQPRTPTVVINEVQPGGAGGGFIEFFNTTDSPVDLQGHYLSDTSANLAKTRISTSVVVPANGLATVPFAGSGLTAGSLTTVYLTLPDGITPIAGIEAAVPLDGRSIGRKPNGGGQWFLFVNPSRGQPNGSSAALAAQLRLNEVHFTADGRVDFIELKNLARTATSASGLFISSRLDFSDKVPLSGSVAAGGHASWDVNFPLDGSGRVSLYLIDAQNNVLAAREFRRRPGRESVQAWPEGSEEWYASLGSTRNAVNQPTRVLDVVINEIFCDPPSDHRNGEFIELYNRGSAPVPLGGWRFEDGISYTFPAGATLAPGAYLVLAADAEAFAAAYGRQADGEYTGNLANKGELVRLEDAVGNLVDQVDYKVGGQWPELTGGNGTSLELIHPSLDNDLPSAWRDSNENSKSGFQRFTVEGRYAQSNSQGAPSDYKELHFHLVGDAHCIIRNIEVVPASGGSNLLVGGTVHNNNDTSPVNSSANGWLIQGTHYASHIQNGELHLISDGHGDNRANRAEIDVLALNAGTTYRISFEARWVSGKPRLICQTWDHSIGKAFLLPIPENLGTPGQANSRLLPAAPPQADRVLHSPAVPTSSQNVVVTARIGSASPPPSVVVKHRPDSNQFPNTTPWTTTPMVDDGTAGDEVAGDGIYSATLTQYRNNGRIVQFYVEAANAGGVSMSPKQGPDRPAMWIVDDRTLPTTLRRQRFIISAADRDALNTSAGESARYRFDFPRLSNHYFPCVFIHDEREIYYGAEIRKSGSPWTRSDGAQLDRGKWKLPGDTPFRGRDKFTFDNDATNNTNRHHNRLHRYWLYLFGHPANENEFVFYVVNGDAPAVREDVEAPDNGLLSRVFPDGEEGELYRTDDEWWFTDSWSRTSRNADWSYKGSDDPIKYHTEWMRRSRETEYDYAALVDMFKTVNSNASKADLDRIIDPDLVLLMAAIRGYSGDWDSMTLNRGKNGYMYRKVTDGRFMFLHWDSDLAFQNTGEVVVGGLAGVRNYIDRPWNRRLLNYYLTELLNKYTRNSPRIAAWFQAEEDSSSAYPFNTTIYNNWFAGRESRIRQEINTAFGGGTANAMSVPLAVSGPNPQNTAANTIDLAGTAPSEAYSVMVEGHPEGVFAWTNQTNWTLSGIVLREGTNTLVVRMLDRDGNLLSGSTTYTVQKSGNGPPVVRLLASPRSHNVSLGQTLSMDASGSFDPEGGALTYEWTLAPTRGVTVSSPAPHARTYVFSVPGLYTVAVEATDSAGQKTRLDREVTVFNTGEFTSFGNVALERDLTASGTERRDNYSPSGWYSLEEKSGRIVVHVWDDKEHDLDSGDHPYIHRDLPDSGDWTLQTDFTLETRKNGSFNTGLYVEMVQDGKPVRYAFGAENGYIPRLRRSTDGSGFFSGGTTNGPWRINSGGPRVTEFSGTVWEADHSFVSGTTFTQDFSGSINGIINDTGREGPVVRYQVAVPNGSYNVVLHASSPQSVVQNVTVNGLDRSDWLVGSGLTAERIFPINNLPVTNGMVDLAVTYRSGGAGQARLTGVEIIAAQQQGPSTVDIEAVRVTRRGDTLTFSRRTGGVWIQEEQVSLPAGSTAHRGGIFAATAVPQSMRVSFDYLLLANPANSNTLFDSLRITEVMYNPLPGGVEFIELQNVGATPLDLTGVYFENNLPFSQFTFGAESLAPGEFIVVTENISLFRSIYGAGPRVAGQWSAGSLSNGGERIVLRDAQGNRIHDFTYLDTDPWPVAADGTGPSLEVIDVRGDYDDGRNWRASAQSGGSPGRPGGADPNLDSDNDGIPDAVEALFGTDPRDPSSRAVVSASLDAQGRVALTWPSVSGRGYRVERSTDLRTWVVIGTVNATGSSSTYTGPAGPLPREVFFRVRAE